MKQFLIGFLSLFVVSCAAQPTSIPTVPQNEESFWVEADVLSCKQYPMQTWCNAKPYPIKKVTYDMVVEADLATRLNFTYVSDDVQYGKDEWHSHYAEVKAGKNWQDDCDGLAETTIDYLAKEGVPRDHMWRLLVSVEKSGVVDHMVAVVATDDGKYYVVGDTGGPTYELKYMEWGLEDTSSVADGPVWYPAKSGS